MHKLIKRLKWVDANLEPIIIVLFVSIMSVVIVGQVIMRYIFNNAFPWAEELTRYMFIWTIYLGVAYSCRTRRHIRVTFLVHSFPIIVQKIIILLGDFILLIYFGLVVAYGVRLNINTFNLNQVTAATKISYVWVYSSIVVCSLLSSIRIFQNIYHKLIHWNVLRKKVDVQDWKTEFEKFLWIKDADTIFHHNEDYIDTQNIKHLEEEKETQHNKKNFFHKDKE